MQGTVNLNMGILRINRISCGSVQGFTVPDKPKKNTLSTPRLSASSGLVLVYDI